MILMIDNYDSFTYNLVQYLGEMKQAVRVVRNDELSLDDIARELPDYIVISPGPATPEKAGITLDVIRRFAGELPMLGVCLGHQAIAEAFGGQVVRAQEPVHGKTSEIYHDQKGVFRGLPSPFSATRYHSLVVAASSLPDVLEATARTEDGVLMGIRHKQYPVEGVQFHPESVVSEYGKELLQNFLGYGARRNEHCV